MSTAELALITGRSGPLVPTPAASRFDLRSIMAAAWSIARRASLRARSATRKAGPRVFLAEALRQAWAVAKAYAASVREGAAPARIVERHALVAYGGDGRGRYFFPMHGTPFPLRAF